MILIDHDSDDGTLELAKPYLGSGLIGMERMPWKGHFSLVAQLRRKREIIATLGHDWVVHVDADEWIMSPVEGETIRSALLKADSVGFNCANFSEFVFVPWSSEDFMGTDYRRLMCTYYFFEPNHPRLMRAWKRDADFENIASGGHKLVGEVVRCHPGDFILRHYICLSVDHAWAKYRSRRFAVNEIDNLGWHRNRVIAKREKLMLRVSPGLRCLPKWNSRVFDRSMPMSEHFWRWV